MSVTSKLFGTTPNGEDVFLYTVENKDIKAEIINLGCIIKSLVVKDKNSNPVDVVLGRDTLSEYLNNDGYFGAAVGRFANRINKAKFEIDGTLYHVTPNEGENTLHGGPGSYAKKVWDCISAEPESSTVSFELKSPDGDEGFPGNLDVIVTYTLTDDNSIEIHYEAVSDKDTVVNFTNHSYFNLNGHNSGDILSHKMKVNSEFFTPANEEKIPLGEVVSVKGTPFDFTEFKTVGKDIDADDEQVRISGGYDNNWIISGRGMREAAVLIGDKTGIKMTTYTDKPGIQIYSGNFLKGDRVCKDGALYHKRNGICLETQYFPNSTEVSHFPSPILRCGEKYDTITKYTFGIE